MSNGHEIASTALALAAMKEFAPEFHNLFGGASKQLGQIFSDGLGFFRKRLVQIYKELEAKREKGELVVESIPEETQDRIARTLFFASFSDGEEMLKYWVAIIAYQAKAPSHTELDMADILSEALKSMTETDAHFLRDYANTLEFDKEEDAQDTMSLQHVSGDWDAAKPLNRGKKIGMSDLQYQTIRTHLCNVGVLGTYNAGTGHGMPFYCLTVLGAELLRMGGWEPRLRQV